MENQKKLTARRFEIKDLGGRTDYERDYTAILFSHAFRRLRFKTQVFHFPRNDHICTRLDHSLYVSTISSIICRNLLDRGCTCDPMLAAAIGLGHDLGHSPFGHHGESTLSKLAKKIGGFKHEKQSLRVVDKIEKPTKKGDVSGLNLTLAVRDGIVNHNGESKATLLKLSEIPDYNNVGLLDVFPCTLEGCVVRLVDKIAYLGRDIEDAIIVYKLSQKTKVFGIDENLIPPSIQAKIGQKNGEIVDYFVKDLLQNSDCETIRLSDEAAALMQEMLDFNYKNIYKKPELQGILDRVTRTLDIIYNYLYDFALANKQDFRVYTDDNNPKLVMGLGEFILHRSKLYFDEEFVENDEVMYTRIIVDYLSTLTDRYVFDGFSDLFLPQLD